jgi:hypothetical protein
MRMMMKISAQIEAVNKAVRDGSAQRIMQTSFETLRPEAAYFYPADDGRTILLFIDVKEVSEAPGPTRPYLTTVRRRAVRLASSASRRSTRSGPYWPSSVSRMTR